MKAQIFVDRIETIKKSDPSNLAVKKWCMEVENCVQDLNRYSRCIPKFRNYNEATHRLFINCVVLAACSAVELPLMVECGQTVSSPSPTYFAGSGGDLDYVVGGKLVVSSLKLRDSNLDPTGDILDYTDEEGNESNVDDVFRRSFDSIFSPGSLNLEAKVRIALGALLQLLAQCHDKSFVSDSTLLVDSNDSNRILVSKATTKVKDQKQRDSQRPVTTAITCSDAGFYDTFVKSSRSSNTAGTTPTTALATAGIKRPLDSSATEVP